MSSVVLQGLVSALAPSSLVAVFIGVFVGIVVGIVPGIGAGVGLSLLLPIIFNTPPLIGLMLLLALWASDGYGASISSILLNVPGGAGAVATCFDGHPMAQQGKAGQAIGISMAASMIGGIIGTIVLMLAAPPLARLAVKIGPAEYTVMAILGLTLIGGLAGKNRVKGLISALIGLMVSFIGYDLTTGFVRYNFGSQYLFDGVEFELVLIGFFAIGELMEAGEEGGTVAEFGKMSGTVLGGFVETFKRPLATIRSSLVGIVLGVLPGIGITISSMAAYDLEKRFSKTPEKFGEGMVEGIIGPEAANNSCQPAALIPTLTLGIPAGSTSAVFLGALIMYGLTPGIDLFTNKAPLVWAMMWGIIVASFAYVLVGLIFAKHFAKITILPIEYLVPCTLVTCFIGAFVTSNSYYDLVTVLIFGIMGYALTLLKYPPAPAILGVVLGPILEKNYFRALLISDGSHYTFIASPLVRVLWGVLLLVVLGPVIVKKIKGGQTK
ncbi:MAG: tripartite tricarboxylate transporter permease [Peptococcaceae bacterium]|jgi:putative tricarboxylic transport membrane protein|nr:tripartite tricarboxylate transporter permease [Peptococcaceae bacterium]